MAIKKIKKTTAKKGKILAKPKSTAPLVTKSPALNKFLFGHDEVTRNDMIEVFIFVALAAFLLFVHLKVNEII